MSECVFCKSYKLSKDLDQEYNSQTFRYAYKVALIRHSQKIGEREYRGRITDYNTRGIGYKLNYCPECGRKL